ncbi:hypothetical protein GJAV_G00008320 [Gymnothorax javanicus]|nr:hypothetical protein GJAV_G00008320 [Gymnothorax javanicus]
MGKLPICISCTLPSWNRSITVALLLGQLCCLQVWAQCRILRCNSEYVTATQHLGGRDGADPRFCGPLRSYAHCTRKMARACRGDLAYHSAVQGIEDLLIQHRCPKTGPTTQPRPPPQAPLSGDACFYEKLYQQRQGRMPEYVHCGVFGDPHVRTFGDEFQTCAVQGAWPLIDNEYLYVQATSAPTGGGAYATALTKITIIFKNWRECTDQQIYQAELDDVPPAFVDGSVTGGERRGQHSLQVRTQDPGRQAEIWAAHIGTTLVVRQSGRSLGLSVRAPRAIVDLFTPEQDLQLCMWGCPSSQQLTRSLGHPSTNAHAHCSALFSVRDIYFQACVFDLLVTGDVNSSAAAVAALKDARAMLSDSDKVHLVPAGTAQHMPSLPAVLVVAVLAAHLCDLLGN